MNDCWYNLWSGIGVWRAEASDYMEQNISQRKKNWDFKWGISFYQLENCKPINAFVYTYLESVVVNIVYIFRDTDFHITLKNEECISHPCCIFLLSQFVIRRKNAVKLTTVLIFKGFLGCISPKLIQQIQL